MQRQAVEGFGAPDLRLHALFLHKTKAEIVEIGISLGIPYEDTWSCYEGGEIHCGLCGTCNERKEAFQLANVRVPTKYRKQAGPKRAAFDSRQQRLAARTRLGCCAISFLFLDYS